MNLKTNGFNPCLLGLAIVCITLLAAYAVTLGQDGAMLLTVFAIIGGIVGYKHREVKENITKNDNPL
jgi:hypothetical protein